ncbi:phosphatidylinositol-specific phospholipase C domain-containing protein [Kitasatospora sp. NPDC056446]|uniref:phosphatidylinositol-specific phospholipase C domain-containing protein n=1 Tax=Kitasatospora sp. NPDC056446 TaxID=3345819 RepID=UPI00367A192A
MSRPSPQAVRGRPRQGLRRLTRLVTACVAVGAALLAPGSAEAAGKPNSAAFDNLGPASKADWMKNVAGGTWLAALSLPGTHDTLAVHGGSSVQTQQDFGDSGATLTAQLDRGIRAIDIRVRVTEGKYFTVHHGSFYQNANFDDVLGKAQAFLGQHSGETIVMRLRAECPLSGGGGFDCKNDPPTVDNAQREAIFRDYVSRYPNLFYSPSVVKGTKADVPHLSQVRGKIVLASFDGLDGDDYGIRSFNDHKEDHYNAPDVSTKWDYVRKNIDQAVADGSGEMFVTYTSASTAPLTVPYVYAGGYVTAGKYPTHIPGVNFKLMDYLDNGGGNGRLGVVMMDFPGWSLVDDIIARNRGNVVADGHPAVWQVKADKTYVDTKYNRCMVRGPEFDSSKTGGLVTQRACQPTAPGSHQWGAERPTAYDGKGYYWIKASNGTCLTAPYNNGTPPGAGTQLYWWGCETRWFSGSQLWNVIPTPIEVNGQRTTGYKFINQWTGLCLSVDPATASTSGGKVTQDICPK